MVVCIFGGRVHARDPSRFLSEDQAIRKLWVAIVVKMECVTQLPEVWNL